MDLNIFVFQTTMQLHLLKVLHRHVRHILNINMYQTLGVYLFIFLNGPRTCGYILDMSHKTELRYVLGHFSHTFV